MTEDDARAMISDLVASTEARDRLVALAELVVDENQRQNLIARSTVPEIWSRHILDSVQLLRWAGNRAPWIDIGTGGGFPGLAIAAVDPRPMLLVEPRRRRADFLIAAASHLKLDNVEVFCCKADDVRRPAAIISARAVGSIENLLRMSRNCAMAGARWILPRGAVSACELESLGREMVFHVEQSVSDARSAIVILDRRSA